jgi:hypothetical protein
LPSAASLVDLGLTSVEGDAVAARDFADALLRSVAPDVDRRDARLLLTALCLHLLHLNGPLPKVSELLDWLGAARLRPQALEVLRDSPMQLVAYTYAEVLSLAPEARSLAVDLCIAAAKLVS